MIKHEKIANIIKVTLQQPFEHFYVLIIPNKDGDDMRDFILACDVGGENMVHMFSNEVESDDLAISIAYYNGIEYISPTKYI